MTMNPANQTFYGFGLAANNLLNASFWTFNALVHQALLSREWHWGYRVDDCYLITDARPKTQHSAELVPILDNRSGTTAQCKHI